MSSVKIIVEIYDSTGYHQWTTSDISVDGLIKAVLDSNLKQWLSRTTDTSSKGLVTIRNNGCIVYRCVITENDTYGDFIDRMIKTLRW